MLARLWLVCLGYTLYPLSHSQSWISCFVCLFVRLFSFDFSVNRLENKVTVYKITNMNNDYINKWPYDVQIYFCFIACKVLKVWFWERKIAQQQQKQQPTQFTRTKSSFGLWKCCQQHQMRNKTFSKILYAIEWHNQAKSISLIFTLRQLSNMFASSKINSKGSTANCPHMNWMKSENRYEIYSVCVCATQSIQFVTSIGLIVCTNVYHIKEYAS